MRASLRVQGRLYSWSLIGDALPITQCGPPHERLTGSPIGRYFSGPCRVRGTAAPSGLQGLQPRHLAIAQQRNSAAMAWQRARV